MLKIDLEKNLVFGVKNPNQMVMIERSTYLEAKKAGTKEIPCVYLKEVEDFDGQHFFYQNNVPNEVNLEDVLEDSVFRFERNHKQLFKRK